ncbi:hypothetical protein M408DRAFT_311583 [Serendipita vermifera MAFF 305830]|uniref:Uncharacterized protein n=1 Tax=Serendipita vermifera MAFF 305830 TaxID=933852 RepID=A0A0C2W004_SERVB|nr:hypothetical protein M408DRAFT_311583 [Serendipita vermifera MAFF 305830]
MRHVPASIELRDIASCDGLNSQRSIWSIAWSCLSTIFLCTWVAVHPNIHFRLEKQDQKWYEQWLWEPLHEFFTHKLLLFLWALLVPEYILAWAVRQYVQAGVISKKGAPLIVFERHWFLIETVPKWSRCHGFFVIMGGFHLFRLPADTPSVCLPLKSFEYSTFVIPTGRYLRRDEIPVCPLRFEDLPVDILELVVPTETELRDRGKSDALTKAIVLVQTVWFIIQCIARRMQHLPLTELEVVTLAYAMLNFFIYVFWWDKPRNVECPIRVYKRSTASHEESGGTAEEWSENWALRWMGMIFFYIMGSQDRYVTLSKQYSVPMFWSGRIATRDLGPAGIGPSILGAAFGAIHCIAWSSEFTSRTELFLWRISCIAMITVPCIVAIICVWWAADHIMPGKYIDLLGYVARLCIILLLLSAWLYIAGRIATLVIAFTSLRSLPPAALMTVNWATFIPHI